MSDRPEQHAEAYRWLSEGDALPGSAELDDQA